MIIVLRNFCNISIVLYSILLYRSIIFYYNNLPYNIYSNN